MGPKLFSYRSVGNIETFYRGDWFECRETCPYCHHALNDLGSFHADAQNVVENSKGETMCTRYGCMKVEPRRSGDFHESGKIKYWYPEAVSPIACLLKVEICPNCGWWYAVQDADVGNNGSAVAAAGVLERFDLSSATVPLEVLQSELAQRTHRISGIHPKRMEDLVGSILSGVYDCEVYQLGYSKDGGIDLLLLKSDHQVAVQVKRRESNAKKESVSLVREFLGASLLASHSDLIYVTSAAGFTKGAQIAAEKAVRDKLVRSYELIDGPRFSSMLSKTVEPIWKTALEEAVDQGGTPDIPNPFLIATNG